MGDPASAEPLLRFINLPGEQISPAPQPGCGCGGDHVSYFPYSGAVQARAVEMLAYLKTPTALQAVLTLAAEHGSAAVRLAALDAYTFNHEDSQESLERARGAARPEETKFVGVPRRTRDADPREFDEQVLAFYDRYPQERPPTPLARPGRANARPEAPRGRRGL